MEKKNDSQAAANNAKTANYENDSRRQSTGGSKKDLIGTLFTKNATEKRSYSQIQTRKDAQYNFSYVEHLTGPKMGF